MSKRIAKIAALQERLAKFLEIPVGDGDDWAPTTPENLTELREIFYEIIGNKFVRDGDGDQVIEFAVSSRADGHLVYDTVPHQPRTDSDEEWDKFYEKSGSAAEYLTSAAHRTLMVSNNVRRFRGKGA